MRKDSRAVARGATDVYLGGDFNLEPNGKRRGSRGTPDAYEYWQHVSRNPPMGWGPPRGTTWGHHVYDYWFAGFGAPGRQVRTVIADGVTMDPTPHQLSDHAASLIST
jgi:hypothetical protein